MYRCFDGGTPKLLIPLPITLDSEKALMAFHVRYTYVIPILQVTVILSASGLPEFVSSVSIPLPSKPMCPWLRWNPAGQEGPSKRLLSLSRPANAPLKILAPRQKCPGAWQFAGGRCPSAAGDSRLLFLSDLTGPTHPRRLRPKVLLSSLFPNSSISLSLDPRPARSSLGSSCGSIAYPFLLYNLQTKFEQV